MSQKKHGYPAPRIDVCPRTRPCFQGRFREEKNVSVPFLPQNSEPPTSENVANLTKVGGKAMSAGLRSPEKMARKDDEGKRESPLCIPISDSSSTHDINL